MVRLEVAFKPEFQDARGESTKKQIIHDLKIKVDSVKTINTYVIDAALAKEQLEQLKSTIFTDPLTQTSSFEPLAKDFDWIIVVGLLPGMKDNTGRTSQEAVEDLLKIKFKENEAIYYSTQYLLKGKLTHEQCDKIASELLANDLIQQWKIIDRKNWDSHIGIGEKVPKVMLTHKPTAKEVELDVSDDELVRISDEGCLALNLQDMKTVRDYYKKSTVIAEREKVGLSAKATDVELELVAQTQSDHCKHKTFGGMFHYTDLATGKKDKFNSLFKTFITASTKALQKKNDWVVSTLWDNAGVMKFDDKNNICIKGETHNSPSNMEAYGGSITGIVGVYRDPMGTGLGSKIFCGTYGYCVGPQFYNGPLKPRLHPHRLLEGVRKGVEDGGNKSGIPTPFGSVIFDKDYLGKCLVYVAAFGIMPSLVKGKPSEKKTVYDGDTMIMVGNRVGRDGVHGVTAASEIYHEGIPAGHVQIGDPYTQKKAHDFLLQVRDNGWINFIQDMGGGGISSSVGETATFSNGCTLDLSKVPLKYPGLDPWEILISESQERMLLAVSPSNVDKIMNLAKLHDVEVTIIGKYENTGKLRLVYDDKTVGYLDMDFIHSGFPQWQIDAHWVPPEMRLTEPVLSEPKNHNQILKDILARPNISSREEIIRMYDHEVQGGSIIKPLSGKNRDVHSDACVLRPVLGSDKGVAITAATPMKYSRIDTYHMTACAIDEAIRRVVAVGGSLKEIGMIDNFCWPSVIYNPKKNPDGRYKAAQLVRANQALYDYVMAFETPCLSGKDSMYVDGNINSDYGQTKRISAQPTLQFTGVGIIDDINKCNTLDFKQAGDLIYVVGDTKDELGASEYYEMLGYVGLNVPKVNAKSSIKIYNSVSSATEKELLASCVGIYRGGLATTLAQAAFAGEIGADIDLKAVPSNVEQDSKILYSESQTRFVITIDPKNKQTFENLMSTAKVPFAQIGAVADSGRLRIKGVNGDKILDSSITELKEAWQTPFR
ncbi:phosphoribosylformylglycinamidine synthase [Candidatus Woesearchaeota archaeon]|mgnify:CR=1 FL=1|nr:phosphoribosylformylglycinamidine synthase [Candidatus Woesearchaeota archaeon]MBT7062946.1 phosphoribosylformylglycinamidine synthase [Candidatus Woesearchaeota archaeon]MBT7402572.1 phosphoribosylformylglycinamidine synthase [Candidatus Woesearchaeota archaeon]